MISLLLATVLSGAPALAAAPSGDVPMRPDLTDPATKRRVQLDVLQGMYDAHMYDDALKVAGELRAQGLDDERLDILQARVMSAKGMRTEASDMLERLVKRKPGSAEAWSTLGVVYADARNFDASAKALEKASRLSPSDAAIFNNLGWVQMTAGKHDKAIESFKRALVLDPSQERTRNNLGFALARAERDIEALEAFRSVGSEADARYNLGVACEMRMDTTSALAQYQAALQAQSDHPLAKAALARLLYRESP